LRKQMAAQESSYRNQSELFFAEIDEKNLANCGATQLAITLHMVPSMFKEVKKNRQPSGALRCA
jgi:hypothetical protein